MLPVVCGSTHSASTFPSVGAIVYAATSAVENAVAEAASCGRRLTVLELVGLLPARARVNTTSFPAAAAVTPIFIRTPTMNARLVDAVLRHRTGVWLVDETVTMPVSAV